MADGEILFGRFCLHCPHADDFVSVRNLKRQVVKRVFTEAIEVRIPGQFER